MKKSLSAKEKKLMTEEEIEAHKLAVYYRKLKKAYRQMWCRASPLRAKALAKVKDKVDGLDVFQCAFCTKWFARSDVAVDHIVPCGGEPDTLADFTMMIARSESHDLQVLCLRCHKEKTKQDKKEIKDAAAIQRRRKEADSKSSTAASQATGGKREAKGRKQADKRGK